MKTIFVSLAALFIFLSVATPALAVPPGKKVEYNNNSLGAVTFSGEVHARQKMTCASCHQKIFATKNGKPSNTLAAHTEGKASCFACHNGTAAFPAKGNCKSCHQPKK